MDIEIKQISKEHVDDFFDFFSVGVESLFPEYTNNIRKYLSSNKAISKEMLVKKIENNNFVLAAFKNNKIIGLLIADVPFGGGSFAHWLIVTGEHQKKGIGRSLLSKWEELALASGAHYLQLEISERNIGFYEKVGFVQVGLQKKGAFGTDNYIYYKLIQEPKEENFLR